MTAHIKTIASKAFFRTRLTTLIVGGCVLAYPLGQHYGVNQISSYVESLIGEVPTSSLSASTADQLSSEHMATAQGLIADVSSRERSDDGWACSHHHRGLSRSNGHYRATSFIC